jgi:hypothetical protein
MKSVAAILAIVGIAASLIVMQSREIALAQQKNSKGVPDVKGPSAQSNTLSPRTHCNGTCMCSGNDCTNDWGAANCKATPTCSGDKGAANFICSCEKKQ